MTDEPNLLSGKLRVRPDQQTEFENNALKAINDSGYVLQIGVESLIRSISAETGWEVISTEQAWHHASTQKSGFCDLVAGRADLRLVIECKRTAEEWHFVRSRTRSQRSVAVSRLSLMGRRSTRSIQCWNDGSFSPDGLEAEFCVLRAQAGEKQPLLERTCASLVIATEAIAQLEALITLRGREQVERDFIPVIVTNAPIVVSGVADESIRLDTGKSERMDTSPVKYVRFRKTFEHHAAIFEEVTSLAAHNRQHSLVFFVVTASYLAEFLRSFTERVNLAEVDVKSRIRAECGLR